MDIKGGIGEHNLFNQTEVVPDKGILLDEREHFHFRGKVSIGRLGRCCGSALTCLQPFYLLLFFFEKAFGFFALLAFCLHRFLQVFSDYCCISTVRYLLWVHWCHWRGSGRRLASCWGHAVLLFSHIVPP